MNAIVAGVVLGLRLVVEAADLDAAGAVVGDEALLDGHFAAALAQREAIAADVGELAARERDLSGVFQRDHAVDRADGGLVRDCRGQGGEAFGVAEAESAEIQMGHRCVRLADEGQEFFRHGIGRPGLRDGFAGPREIGQLAGAAEEPFAGFVEQREQVLDHHPREMIEGRVGFLGGPADLEGPAGRIGRLHAAAGRVPLVIERHHRILGFGRLHFAERRQLLGVDADRLFREARRRGATRDGAFVFDAADIVAAGLFAAGPDGATVGPELFEGLGAGRNLQCPASVLAGGEGGQFLAARDQHLRPRGGFVRDRLAGLAGIFRVEGDGGREPVGAFGEDDADGFGERTRQFAYGQSGAVQRGQRCIGLTGGAIVAFG